MSSRDASSSGARPDAQDPLTAAEADSQTPVASAPNVAGSDEPLRKAQAEAAEMKDAWLRARADVENLRRQSQADLAKAYKYAIEKFAVDLLPVKDALEQTLASGASVLAEALRSGTELTLKSLAAAFARAGITEIDPAGSKFDPHLHQAMQAVASDQSPNTVVTVFQKGYLINDRLLRPALVSVAKVPEDTSGARPADDAGPG
jgi:molecular chaperone GrpE